RARASEARFEIYDMGADLIEKIRNHTVHEGERADRTHQIAVCRCAAADSGFLALGSLAARTRVVLDDAQQELASIGQEAPAWVVEAQRKSVLSNKLEEARAVLADHAVPQAADASQRRDALAALARVLLEQGAVGGARARLEQAKREGPCVTP